MGRRQKGKHLKRGKSWHRIGAGTAFRTADRDVFGDSEVYPVPCPEGCRRRFLTEAAANQHVNDSPMHS
jgi:hypothetical protein